MQPPAKSRSTCAGAAARSDHSLRASSHRAAAQGTASSRLASPRAATTAAFRVALPRFTPRASDRASRRRAPRLAPPLPPRFVRTAAALPWLRVAATAVLRVAVSLTSRRHYRRASRPREPNLGRREPDLRIAVARPRVAGVRVALRWPRVAASPSAPSGPRRAVPSARRWVGHSWRRSSSGLLNERPLRPPLGELARSAAASCRRWPNRPRIAVTTVIRARITIISQ